MTDHRTTSRLRRHGPYSPMADIVPPPLPYARRRREMVDYSPVGVWMIAGTLLAVIVVTFVLHGWLL